MELYLLASMTCSFQKPITNTPIIPTMPFEATASRACGNRLSLRNQYDTKTPRASTFSQGFLPDPAQLTRLAGLNSRHEKIHSVGFEWTPINLQDLVENVRQNFLEPGNRKNLPERPNHRRTKAACSSKRPFKRITCMREPQAVQEDRFQECIGIL